jgi:hypothetical protein
MSVCKCGHAKVFHMLSGRCARYEPKTVRRADGRPVRVNVQCKCEEYEEGKGNDLRRD